MSNQPLTPDEETLLSEYRKSWGRRYHRVASERDVAEEQRNELLSVLRQFTDIAESDDQYPIHTQAARYLINKITHQIEPVQSQPAAL